MNIMVFVIGLASIRLYKYLTDATDVQVGMLVVVLMIGFLVSIFQNERKINWR